MNGEPFNMIRICRWTASTSLLWVTLLGLTWTNGPAQAGGLLHKKQVVYVAQAPNAVMAQAPVLYTAQAPVAHTALAPVVYTAQAPVTYTAQAPTTYVVSTGAAPVANSTAMGAAPASSNAPTEGGIRISLAIRSALYADLVAYYHGADSGDTRLEKIKAVRDRAREEYLALIEGEENEELNSSEQQDLRTLVDWVISGGTAGSQRSYYPPLAAAPGSGAGGPGTGFGPTGGMVVQPTTYWVPIYARPQHPIHKLLHLP
jgi:hypothetical protein